MRRARDILKDLGFNKDAPVGSRDAFLRHLMKHASESVARSTPEKEKTVTENEEQLSFDPQILNTIAK